MADLPHVGRLLAEKSIMKRVLLSVAATVALLFADTGSAQAQRIHAPVQSPGSSNGYTPVRPFYAPAYAPAFSPSYNTFSYNSYNHNDYSGNNFGISPGYSRSSRSTYDNAQPYYIGGSTRFRGR